MLIIKQKNIIINNCCKAMVFTILLFLYQGCSRSYSVLNKFKHKIYLSTQKETEIKHQLNPKQIYLMDSVIVLQNTDTDGFMFSILDTSNFKLLARFGKQGSGPNEIGDVCCTNKINGNSLIVRDLDTEAYLFSIKNILSGDISPIKTFTPHNKTNKLRCGSICFVGNTTVCSGIFAKGRYAILDSTNCITNYFVQYPEFDNPNNDSLVPALAFQATLCNQPNGNLFASLSSGIIDIAEYKPTGEIVLKTRNKHYNTEKKHGENVNIDGVSIPIVATSIKSTIGFDAWHFQATTQTIYCLFSEKRFEEFMEHGDRITYPHLLSFDWNGNQQTHYILDKEVIGCAISSDNNVAFFLSFNENDEPIISKAYLKDI